MLTPETERSVQDLADLLMETSQKVDLQVMPDGTTEKVLTRDPKRLLYQLLNINRSWGRFVLFLESFMNKASECRYNMSEPRASQMADAIEKKAEAYLMSVIAKSSETFRDKNNTQVNVLGMFGRGKQDRYYSPKEELEQSMLRGFLGGKKKDDGSA